MNLSPRDYDLGKEHISRLQGHTYKFNQIVELPADENNHATIVFHINKRRVVFSLLLAGYICLMTLFLATQTQAQETTGFDPGFSPPARDTQMVQVRYCLDAFADGDVETAMSIVEAGIAIDDDFAVPYVVRSLILNSMGEFDAALEDALLAYELHPQTEVGHFALASAYEALGDYEQAGVHYGQYIAMLESKGSAGYLLVDYFTEGSSVDLALELAEAYR